MSETRTAIDPDWRPPTGATPPTATDHIQMLLQETHWPSWPALPLKDPTRPDANSLPLCGVALADAEDRTIDPIHIYHCNLARLAMCDDDQREALLAHATVDTYPDAAAAVAAGWVVD
jgi:hypothetical protein